MSSSFVLDCSVAAAFFLDDEKNFYNTAALERCLRQDIVWATPLLAFELSNTLLQASKRGRFTLDRITPCVEALFEMNILVQQYTLDLTAKTIALAAKYTLTSYDASYLALAKQYNAPLATEDKMLKAAAQQEQLYWTPA
jgi:predicted nucleic acid-binding protein